MQRSHERNSPNHQVALDYYRNLSILFEVSFSERCNLYLILVITPRTKSFSDRHEHASQEVDVISYWAVRFQES